MLWAREMAQLLKTRVTTENKYMLWRLPSEEARELHFEGEPLGNGYGNASCCDKLSM